MKIPIELIRDSDEDNEPEELENTDAEKYHLILQRVERKTVYNDLSCEAERALKSAPVLPWEKFFNKWRNG